MVSFASLRAGPRTSKPAFSIPRSSEVTVAPVNLRRCTKNIATITKLGALTATVLNTPFNLFKTKNNSKLAFSFVNQKPSFLPALCQFSNIGKDCTLEIFLSVIKLLASRTQRRSRINKRTATLSRAKNLRQ